MTRDLAAEIRVYLAEHGPATSDEIALNVIARRADVTDALAAGGFVRAQRPVGGHPHAVYWKAVPSRPTASHASRAALLYQVLRDGKPHSRREIFGRVGYMLTNNAASECRARLGLDIVCERHEGEYVYRLVGALAEADAGQPGAVSGSVSASSSVLGAAVPAIVGIGDGTAAPSTQVPGQLSIDEAA